MMAIIGRYIGRNQDGKPQFVFIRREQNGLSKKNP